MAKKIKEGSKNQASTEKLRDPDYLWSMSCAPRIDEGVHWFQLLPIAFFTAFVIMITRMASYSRPMAQFYWANKTSDLTDFFSYYKMIAIVICGTLALIILLYRIFSQSLAIKKSIYYIPIAVYSLFVILSYVFSEYKLFSWLGFNDRFEGTLPILGYMVMLLYIINSIKTENAIKWVVYPIGISSVLLGLLGVTQALDHDFFRTTIGQKLITPNVSTSEGMTWDLIDKAAAVGKRYLEFNFTDKQIYQTVYNINYVSFYLTLLIPLFGMLFIRSWMRGKEEPVWKKILWGAIFTLSVFNLIGSVSSGGYLGIFIILVFGFIVLNKRIVKWWKPVCVLFALAILMCFANFDQLQSEFNAAKGFFGSNTQATATKDNTATTKAHIDYIDTDGNDLKISINGNEMIITTYPDDPSSITVKDSDGNKIPLDLISAEQGYIHGFRDARFGMCNLRPAIDENNNNYYLINIEETQWPFMLTEDGPKYVNGLGNQVDLNPGKQIGFENNPNFGSGRGYIWSTSFPMLKDTLLLGHGADTYCLYYPHDNYVGKYNAGWQINMIVDKPHCAYLGIAINTGVISLFALLALWCIYIIQSAVLYFKRDFKTDFTTYVGLGIFLGVSGFLAAALVNDTSVSVMPLFYGLLGTGIAINDMLRRQNVISK